MTLPLILAEDPETPLSDLLHPFDFYDLALALEDRGIAALNAHGGDMKAGRVG